MAINTQITQIIAGIPQSILGCPDSWVFVAGSSSPLILAEMKTARPALRDASNNVATTIEIYRAEVRWKKSKANDCRRTLRHGNQGRPCGAFRLTPGLADFAAAATHRTAFDHGTPSRRFAVIPGGLDPD